jgi:hypothetical protein
MFVSFGAEEAGVEASENDWLAGSDAFVKQHPEILRRLAFGFNIDVTGWHGERGVLQTTPDATGFLGQTVRDLGLGERVVVRPTIGSTTDTWNLSSVGGGAAAIMSWVSETGGVFGGESSYSAIYHTDLDVFSPSQFPNLEHDLRLEALAIARTDRATTLPIDFTAMAAWLGESLKADEPRAPGVSFADVHGALDRFRAEAARVEQARAAVRDAGAARRLNAWLMRTRKDVFPWLVGRSAANTRGSAYVGQLQTLGQARAAAEAGDAPAAAQALQRLLGAGSRASAEVFRRQRLYFYTAGDWSAQFGHRARPVPADMYDVYQRIQGGRVEAADLARLRAVEEEIRGAVVDAMFIVAGKLNEATAALRETPLP